MISAVLPHFVGEQSHSKAQWESCAEDDLRRGNYFRETSKEAGLLGLFELVIRTLQGQFGDGEVGW